ncbi:MAG: AbrB family transcriptional regulator [Hyphomicrobiales bacterium]|nr:AbrB family transcriptional regulator [Hyphomicrobiales bacterium]
MAQTAEDLKTTIITLAAGAAGLSIAWFLRFPAPALTGPALLVTALAVAGVRLSVPDLLRNASFVVIGLSMGTGVTPEVYETARQWPLSFVLLAISVCVIFIACRYALQWLWKQDPPTAILSSTPGHLSYILGLSTETRGDFPTISVIQSTRVLALTLLVPFAVALMGYDTTQMGLPGATMKLLPLAVSMVLAMLLGMLFKGLRVPAALLIGGMVFSVVTHLSALVEGHVPLWLAIPAFATLGTLIGTRFAGVSLKTLHRAFGAGLMVTLIAFAVTICFATLLVQFVDLPLPQVLIAFAPGGVESMAAVAVILGADPTFVVAHHVWRLVILTFLAPAVLARSNRQ